MYSNRLYGEAARAKKKTIEDLQRSNPIGGDSRPPNSRTNCGLSQPKRESPAKIVYAIRMCYGAQLRRLFFEPFSRSHVRTSHVCTLSRHTALSWLGWLERVSE